MTKTMIYDVTNLPPRLVIGKEGEHLSTQIDIDISKWAEKYPGASYTVVIRRDDGQTYPVAVEKSGSVITWYPTITDLQPGYGKLEVRAYQGDKIVKSSVIQTYVSMSLDVGAYPDPEMPDWAKAIIDAYAQISPATQFALGLVKVDGETIVVDADGTLHAVGGGSGGTSDYNDLINKPKINGTELKGNVTLPTLSDVDREVVSYVNAHKAELKGDRGEQGVPGPKGADGYTPQKNIDYFDGQNGKDGKDGVDGKDYTITSADYSAIADVVLTKLPQAESEEF